MKRETTVVVNLDRFKPLLAATIETEADFASLTYPLLASPKLDGIRVILHPSLGPVTRSLKSVPNKFIRDFLSAPALRYLDGEIIVGKETAPDVFNRTQSAVMSMGGEPSFTYVAFDHLGMSTPNCPFEARLLDTRYTVGQWNKTDPVQATLVRYLEHTMIHNREELDAYEEWALGEGYEGVMLRTPNGKYKFNRSTLREQILMKLKRFLDDEAEITGWEPLLKNENEAFIDERGYQKRSAHQSGKIADMTRAGKLNMIGRSGRWKDVVFDVGSGFDDDLRRDIAANFDQKYKGKMGAYKYLPHGSKDAPRHPIWKGLRHD